MFVSGKSTHGQLRCTSDSKSWAGHADRLQLNGFRDRTQGSGLGMQPRERIMQILACVTACALMGAPALAGDALDPLDQWPLPCVMTAETLQRSRMEYALGTAN